MINRLAIPLVLLLLAVAMPARAAEEVGAPEAGAFPSPAVADEALSDMRGGFALPGGLDVAVAVQSDTRVNGVLMLRSVFVVDQGPATLAVFGRTGDAPSAVSVTGAGGSTSTLSFTSKAAAIGGAAEGLTKLALGPDGAPVAASGGTVRVETAGAQNRVVLSQPTLDISHLSGQAYGSIVANRGNDVTVDTATNINVDLRNATALNLGSAAFRIDALALDVATRLGR